MACPSPLSPTDGLSACLWRLSLCPGELPDHPGPFPCRHDGSCVRLFRSSQGWHKIVRRQPHTEDKQLGYISLLGATTHTAPLFPPCSSHHAYHAALQPNHGIRSRAARSLSGLQQPESVGLPCHKCNEVRCCGKPPVLNSGEQNKQRRGSKSQQHTGRAPLSKHQRKKKRERNFRYPGIFQGLTRLGLSAHSREGG